MQAQSDQAPVKRYRPTPQDWLKYKDTILDLWKVQKLTFDELPEAMLYYGNGFNATKKMYVNRLGAWNARKYMSAEDRNALCDKVLYDYNNGRDLSYMTPRDVRKLVRHCRDTGKGSGEGLLDILRKLEDSFSLPEVGERSDRGDVALADLSRDETTSSDQSWIERASRDDGALSLDRYASATSSLDQAVPEESTEFRGFHSDFDPLYEGQFSHMSPQDSSNILGEDLNMQPLPEFLPSATPQSLSPAIPRTNLQLGGMVDGFEKLLRSIQNYYDAKLEQHVVSELTIRSPPAAETMAIIHPQEESDVAVLQTEAFWTDVKTAFYFLKTGEDKLAWDLLRQLGHQVPQVCEHESFTLLRDLCATLSLVNTNTWAGVRTELLKLFVKFTETSYVFEDSLHSICVQLQQDWVTDEALKTALKLLVQATALKLPSDHKEAFELRRTFVRFLRRLKDFRNAELIAWRTINEMERLRGKNDVKTRLARTELVYIQKDQGKLLEASQIAEDIVYRGKQDEGKHFPGKRSVYAMEDVADICEMLGKTDEARVWLQRALKGALKLWGNQAASIHIKNKLEMLHSESNDGDQIEAST